MKYFWEIHQQGNVAFVTKWRGKHLMLFSFWPVWFSVWSKRASIQVFRDATLCIWCNITEDLNLQQHYCKNLKSTKNVYPLICKTGFLDFIFVWVKILVLVLKRKHRLRISEKIMLGRTFGCERDEVTRWRRILLDGRLRNLYSAIKP